MNIAIIIELNENETVPPSPLLSDKAIEKFKNRHPGLEAIATIVVKKGYPQDVQRDPESIFHRN